MTENELGLLSSVELERKKFLPNVVKPVVGNPSVQRNTATFLIAGTATGGSSAFLGVRVEGTDVSFSTTLGDNATTSATGFRSALSGALVSAFGSNQYSVGGTGGTIILTKLNGNDLWVEDTASTDATQSIVQTAGTRVSNSFFVDATLSGTGLPLRYEDGHFLTIDIPTDGRGGVVFYKLSLKNFTGSPATARWRVWTWYDYVGWTSGSITSLTESSGMGTAEQVGTNTFTGARKVALEFVDNGTTGGDLTTGSGFTAIMINSN